MGTEPAGRRTLQAAAAGRALPEPGRMGGAARRPAGRPADAVRRPGGGRTGRSSTSARAAAAASPPSARTRTPTSSRLRSRHVRELAGAGASASSSPPGRKARASASRTCSRITASPAEARRPRSPMLSRCRPRRGRRSPSGPRGRLRDRRPRRHRRAGHPRRPPGPPEAQAEAAADFITEAAGLDAGRPRRPCRSRHRPLRGPEDHRGRRRAARLPRARTMPAATGCSCRSRTSSS